MRRRGVGCLGGQWLWVIHAQFAAQASLCATKGERSQLKQGPVSDGCIIYATSSERLLYLIRQTCSMWWICLFKSPQSKASMYILSISGPGGIANKSLTQAVLVPRFLSWACEEKMCKEIVFNSWGRTLELIMGRPRYNDFATLLSSVGKLLKRFSYLKEQSVRFRRMWGLHFSRLGFRRY